MKSLNQHRGSQSLPLITTDEAWIITAQQRSRLLEERIEQELKRYKNNQLKESIRMAYLEQADCMLAKGAIPEALKALHLCREVCGTAKQLALVNLKLAKVLLSLSPLRSAPPW